MAEKSRPLQNKKLTVPSANGNTASKISTDNPTKQTLSGAGYIEKHLAGGQAAAGYQSMGSTNQPLSRNANMLKAQSDPVGRVSSVNSSSQTTSGNGNTAECQNMASYNQLTSGSTNMLASLANLDSSHPSSLRSSSTCTHYSLEISLSTANGERGSQPLPLLTPSESQNDQNKQTNLSRHPKDTKLAVSPHTSSATKLLSSSDRPVDLTAEVRQCRDKLGSFQVVTSTNESGLGNDFPSISRGNGKLEAEPFSKLDSHQFTSASMTSAEGEEDMFYAFVILHAVEDAEEAARIKMKLERISTMTGATFAEDFAEPGRSPFRCIEDAINNSAFTMLLLTPNFNTHLNEMTTDSALINSIEKTHKFNTVIPLMPQENSLAKTELPLVLRTRNPLREKEKTFDFMAKKLLHPDKIQKQKATWKQEQSVRKQQEMQQQLKEENRLQKELLKESLKVQELKYQRMQLQMQQQRFPNPYVSQPQEHQAFSPRAQPFGPAAAQSQELMCPHYSNTGWHQPPSNIHIQNAKYIMIGNDSSMTVGACENNSEDEDSI